MANTYSQISVQIVFAVKGRDNLLSSIIRPRIFEYIAGIVKKQEQTVLAVNGWKDHVHVFCGLDTNKSVADLTNSIKAGSSKWINENGIVKGKFQWQTGYSAFSYSHSQRDTVIKYIMNQEKHHAINSFREEYLDMLQKAEIEFDEKYLFEFYE